MLPLVVDLDGSLLRSDLLHESALKLLRERPLVALRMPGWLVTGKAHMKRQIASHVDIDVGTLPFDEELLAWLRSERASGRRVVLCTASDETYARQVAAHLGVFDEVIASDGSDNVSSHRKADALVAHFGAKGFDYVGDSRADVAVWSQAHRAIVVGAKAGVLKAAGRVADVHRHFRPQAGSLGHWVRALRLHQWVKNLLLFLPLLGSHRLTDAGAMLQCLFAFVSFGLCASSVYVVNDLMDVESDRRHERKRMRPFASGVLSHLDGVAVSAVCVVAAFAIAAGLRPAFAGWLAVYWLLTL